MSRISFNKKFNAKELYRAKIKNLTTYRMLWYPNILSSIFHSEIYISKDPKKMKKVVITSFTS